MTDIHNHQNTDSDGQLESVSFQKVVRSVILFTIIGVTLYVAAALSADYKIVIDTIAKFPIRALLGVLGLVVAGWLIRATRFYYYLITTGVKLPFYYVVSVFLGSFALTGTPGKMGEAIKALFLKRDYNTPPPLVFGLLVVERLMDLLAILFLGAFSLVLFSEWFGIFIICVITTFALGLFLTMENLYRPILGLFGKLPIIGWIADKTLEVLLAGKDLMTIKTLILGFLLSVFAWACESACMFIIMVNMDLIVTPLQSNFVYCFGQIVGALSMLPGGIGGAEASMAGLMTYLGIGYSKAVPAIMLLRVATLWFAIIVGIIFMILMAAYSRKTVFTDEKINPVSSNN